MKLKLTEKVTVHKVNQRAFGREPLYEESDWPPTYPSFCEDLFCDLGINVAGSEGIFDESPVIEMLKF